LAVDAVANTYAYKRVFEEREVLVYLNFSNASQTISTETPVLNDAHEPYLTSGDVVFQSNNAKVRLPAYGFLIAVK
jgi:hypothetical protein